MSDFTSGPWLAERDPEGHWNVTSREGEVIGCEGLYRCDGQDEPNAHLIAAAHDLLESLTEMLAYKYDGDPRRQADCAQCQKARAAIAKATQAEGEA